MRTDTETAIQAEEGLERVRTELPIKLYEGNRNYFSGITRDISISGFSAFLKRVSPDSRGDENDCLSLAVGEVWKKLSGRRFYAVMDMEREIDPVAVRVTSAERSRRTDFEVFATFKFDGLNESDSRAIADLVSKSVIVETETVAIRRGSEQSGLGCELSNESEDVHIVFRARYFYIAYMRDLCDKLAAEMGFEQDEVFGLKLAMDEVLTNALEHGCAHYGKDKIDVKMSFTGDGISVRVRDPGGKGFDHTRYRGETEEGPRGIRSGLCLVNNFVDHWEVHTSPDEYTEVVFFKKKSGEQEE